MTDTSTAPTPARAPTRRGVRGTSGSAALEFAGRFGLPTLLALLILVFSLKEPDTFGTWTNFRLTFDQQAPVLIAAFAVMLPLIVGEFDLSIGANVYLGNVFVVGLTGRDSFGTVPAILIALAICTSLGLVNGLAVMKLQVNAFVATLATGTIAAGIALAYSHSTDLADAPSSFTDIARGTIIGEIPNTILYAAVIAVLLCLVIEFMPVGRRMRAVGGNRRAAALTGISPMRFVVGPFVVGGLLAGVAGVLLGAQLGAAASSSNGALLLPAFAAAFLGATAIEPGRFNVIGTVVAVAFLALTVTGLELVGVEQWVEPVINGGALLGAVALSAWALRLRNARLRREQLQAIEHAGAA